MAAAKTTFQTLMRRVARVGFKPDFVRQALLPDWWDPSCERDVSLLPDVEFRIARFLNLPIDALRASRATLPVPEYPNARLRHVKNVDADRLGPAIHAGLQIAAAAIRSLRPEVRRKAAPTDAAGWLRELRSGDVIPDLQSISSNLWDHGIPVIHVEVLPTPKYQGLACVVEDHPAIILGHSNDEPARLAFHLAHEVGHIAHGDCATDQPVVDEDEGIADTSAMERRANEFAWSLLAGAREMPHLQAQDYRSLANDAAALEQRERVDAGAAIWAWALRTGKYQDAQLALKALYRAQGGRRILREQFARHVDIEAASESDRALLRCVFLDPERDAAH